MRTLGPFRKHHRQATLIGVPRSATTIDATPSATPPISSSFHGFTFITPSELQFLPLLLLPLISFPLHPPFSIFFYVTSPFLFIYPFFSSMPRREKGRSSSWQATSVCSVVSVCQHIGDLACMQAVHPSCLPALTWLPANKCLHAGASCVIHMDLHVGGCEDF